jgi:hypothetical protein
VICGAMFWKGSDPKSKWNIVYDLRIKSFGSSGVSQASHHLTVTLQNQSVFW